MTALQRALELRLQSDWIGASTSAAGSYPPINIFQQNDDFVAVIELPGVEKDDLQIEAKESTVRISGRKMPNYDDKASVHRRERLFGVFDRRCRCRSDRRRRDPRGISRRFARLVHSARREREAALHQDQLTTGGRIA